MQIRPEAPQDYPSIEKLLDVAFAGTYESGLVRAVRASAAYLPEFTLVAEDHNGEIVGYVMLSAVSIETAATRDEAVALGPVAVVPARQRDGIGGALIRDVLARLDAGRPDELCVLLGHPSYYPRFGFTRASLQDVYPSFPWSDEAFMARGGRGKRGMVRYSDAFAVHENHSNVRYRRAERSDMRTVARVFAISFRHSLSHLPNLHTADEDAQFFGGKVFDENEVWLAEDGAGVILGFIAFTHAHDFVNHLYVLPAVQRDGYGSALLKLAQERANSLQLWTFQCNARARTFYKRNGFREVRLTSGEGNEEKEPDVLLEWTR